jgi:TadE-like protein
VLRLVRKWRRHASAKPGQSVVELALVVSILATLLLGIIEVVGLYSTRSYLQDATRAAVRLGSLSYNDNKMTTEVLNTLSQHGMNTIHNGVCDIQKIEIYQSDPNGVPIAGPNSEDVYPVINVGGVCIQGAHTMYGWPPGVRNVVVAPGAATPDIGVRVTYSYKLRTPIFRAFGTSFTMTYNAVLALGGDNANNFLALPSSTPVPTYTASSTSTNTATNTSTPTVTNTPTNTSTPSITPTWTPTPTFMAGSATWTRTATPTITPTPTISPTPTLTNTPTATPTVTPPPLLSVQWSIPCDNSNHLLVGPGVVISWSGTVPGATSYELHYVVGAVDNVVASFAPIYNQYPFSAPPYYTPTLTSGNYWYVKAILPSGSFSIATSPAIDAAHACALNS